MSQNQPTPTHAPSYFLNESEKVLKILVEIHDLGLVDQVEFYDIFRILTNRFYRQKND